MSSSGGLIQDLNMFRDPLLCQVLGAKVPRFGKIQHVALKR